MLSLTLACRSTAREIAAAMTYLHSLDILHGDLTGGNILLVSSNKDARMFIAKVADFGLSRVLSAEAISTGTYGTVTHMPPELLTTGGRSDLEAAVLTGRTFDVGAAALLEVGRSH